MLNVIASNITLNCDLKRGLNAKSKEVAKVRTNRIKSDWH